MKRKETRDLDIVISPGGGGVLESGGGGEKEKHKDGVRKVSKKSHF